MIDTPDAAEDIELLVLLGVAERAHHPFRAAGVEDDGEDGDEPERLDRGRVDVTNAATETGISADSAGPADSLRTHHPNRNSPTSATVQTSRAASA
jgi:hypothetical protein